MYNADLQSRFTNSYLDAMTGYMTASNAASSAVMGNIIDFWASAARTLAGEQARAAPATIPMVPWGFFPTFAPAASPIWPQPAASAASAFSAPWDFWMSMTPFGRSPVVLQMAYGMMAFGVPRDVAMPTAEANATFFDAANTAAAPFQEVFSSYRSDGGHASSQIKYLQRMVAALMLSPIGAVAVAPWMHFPRNAGF
jgi:hypothetical protein